MCPVDAAGPSNRRRSSCGEPQLFGAFAKEHAGKKSGDEHEAFSGGEEPQCWSVKRRSDDGE